LKKEAMTIEKRTYVKLFDCVTGIEGFSGGSGENALKTKYCLNRSVAKVSLFCLAFSVLSER